MRHYGELRPTSCCGLKELHGLVPHGNSYSTVAIVKTSFRAGLGYFATTTADMKPQVKALKSAGFRKVGKWRNRNTARTVTLWVKNVRK